ncbi:hypothetical protein ACIOGZ_28455 [Kitasatospora sp. NPDC088160]|uniref:hypothetical protein n=1 Tax=Kitasatospora sp. NPDC088160 TaxID=3364072 RepID=UPI003823FEA0
MTAAALCPNCGERHARPDADGRCDACAQARPAPSSRKAPGALWSLAEAHAEYPQVPLSTLKGWAREGRFGDTLGESVGGTGRPGKLYAKKAIKNALVKAGRVTAKGEPIQRPHRGRVVPPGKHRTRSGVRLLGIADLADLFGISPYTARVWSSRPNTVTPTFLAPNAWIDAAGNMTTTAPPEGRHHGWHPLWREDHLRKWGALPNAHGHPRLLENGAPNPAALDYGRRRNTPS